MYIYIYLKLYYISLSNIFLYFQNNFPSEPGLRVLSLKQNFCFPNSIIPLVHYYPETSNTLFPSSGKSFLQDRAGLFILGCNRAIPGGSFPPLWTERERHSGTQDSEGRLGCANQAFHPGGSSCVLCERRIFVYVSGSQCTWAQPQIPAPFRGLFLQVQEPRGVMDLSFATI